MKGSFTINQMMSVLVMQLCRMLSVAAIRFEDRFCVNKKVGYVEVGRFQHGVLCTWQLPWVAVEALVGIGWTILT